MAFPESPSNNQRYTFRGKVYQYNSSRGVWRTVAGIDIEQTDLISNTSLNSTLSSYWPSANVITYVGSAGGGGVTTYANNAALPTSGFSAGDLAFSSANNTLFFNNGNGWYKIALVNQTPTITASVSSLTLVPSSSYEITYTISDPEGLPVTVSVSNSGISNTDVATITHTNANNTISITTGSVRSDDATITITASDGINQTFSNIPLSFSYVSDFWSNTVLSVGTSSTNGLDNSTFIDRSSNAHTITVGGSPVQTAFNPYLDTWSVEFDGSSYLRCDEAVDAFTSTTDTFTLEAWVYPTVAGSATASSDDYIFALNRISDGNNQLLIGMQNIYYGGSAYDLQTVIETDKWTHLAVVFDGLNLKIYTNGTLNTTVQDTVDTPLQDLTFALATEFDGADGGSPGNYYSGYISSVRVSDNVRYTTTFTPPDSAFTDDANTTFIGCQSNRPLDISSNENTVLAFGTPVISAYNPFGQGSEYAVGENKGSVSLSSGFTTYVQIPDDDVFELTGDFTIELWAYSTGTSSGYQSIIGGNGSSSNGWNIYETGSTSTALFFHGSFLITSASGDLPRNQWNHISVTRSGSSIKMFVNGTQVGSTATSDSTLNQATSNAGTRIGYDINANGYFNGNIADVKIINGSASYTTDFTPPTTPLGNTNAALYLPMDNAGVFDKVGINGLRLIGDVSTSTTETKYASSSIVFDGNGDYIIGGEQEFGSDDLTWEMWINTTSSTQYATLYSRTPLTFANGMWTLMINQSSSTAGDVALYMGDYNVSSPLLLTTGVNVRDGSWHHIAVVRNGSQWNLYVDGTSRASQTWAGTISDISGNQYIGYDQNYGRAYTGYLENLQIFRGTAKYTTTFTPPTNTQGRTYQAQS
jgi:hypothetical protein